MSRLEKYINENREAFDSELPSAAVWQEIESKLPLPKQRRIFSLLTYKWAVAAAALVVALVGLFFVLQKKPASGSELVKTSDSTEAGAIAGISPEASPEVNQFARLIAAKQEELKKVATEQPELYQKFTKDIIQLDSTYSILKKQLSIVPNKEQLIEAMIQNLQLQLQVLNQQLNIIHQIQQSKNNSHEKTKVFM